MDKNLFFKTIITLSILFAPFFILSCDRNPNCIENRIRTLTVNGILSTYRYEADPPAVISKLISITYPTNIITYDYSVPGKITKTQTNPASSVEYTLNNLGQAICDNRNTNSCTPGTPFTYLYNNEGYAEAVYDGAGFLSRTFKNGDITSERRNAKLIDTITYTNLCSPLENMEGIFGKNNAHWPDVFTHDNVETHNTYELDGYGRVIKRTMSGGINQVWEITYY